MGVRLVVLASGTGTNFAAIADAVQSGVIPNAEIVALISNRADALALNKAKERAIPTHALANLNKNEYEEKLRELLKRLKPDFVLLAGYMKILAPETVALFSNRIVNIHPSLLPSFPGLHAVRQALDHGVRYTGVTVHLVTAELDAGPILDQRVVPVEVSDDEASLFARIQKEEHPLYIAAVKKLCENFSGRK